MKRQIFFGTLLSTALAVGVGAQQTPPSSSSSPGQSDRSGQTVTVTGCLQSGSGASGSTASSPTGAPAGQAGASSSSSRGGQFILANATMGSGSGSATGTTGGTPPAGAPSSSSSSASGKSYRLTGGDTEDLQKYVNSKVEVTGTLQDSSRSSSGSTGATGSPSTGAGAGTGTTGSAAGSSSSSMAGNMPQLRVTSVRQVSGSCTGGENR